MLTKILSIAKWIAGVVGGITAVVGIITIIYTQGRKFEQKRQKESTVEFKIDKLIISDSLKNIKLDQVLSSQQEFTFKQGQVDKKLDRLNNSYIDHLKSDKKIDELIRYLENSQSDLKKNNFYPIVLNEVSK